MENKTKIIYLTGRLGVGKYTIAKALSKYGFIVCDNQLVNNPIFALLNYDGITSIPEVCLEFYIQYRKGNRQLYQQVK